jgi:hypothetical protein
MYPNEILALKFVWPKESNDAKETLMNKKQDFITASF